MAIDLTGYKNIDFKAFLLQQGYDDQTQWAKSKKSQNYLAFENHAYNDKVIIKKSINAFSDVHTSSKYKDLIQFVIDRLNTVFLEYKTETSDFHSAIKMLNKYVANPNQPQNSSYTPPITPNKFNLKDFIINENLPQKNYLHTIGLTDNIIYDPIFHKKIYSVKNPIFENDKIVHHGYSNISFPYIKEIAQQHIVGFEQRNVNYKGHAINSDKKNGVWISNKQEQTTHLIITESAKDALGHYATYPSTHVMYCSVGGNITKDQMTTINGIADQLKLIKVLGFDNDISGKIFTLQYLLHEINPINTVHSFKAKGEESLRVNLIYTNSLEKNLNDFFNTSATHKTALIKPIAMNDGILNFEINSNKEILTSLIYHVLNTNKHLFAGKYLIQVPTNKDFFEDFTSQKKTLNQNTHQPLIYKNKLYFH